MPAIMLKHEQPQQKPSSRQDQDQANPVTELQRDRRGSPKKRERDQGDAELEKAPRPRRLAIAGDDLEPGQFGAKVEAGRLFSGG